MINWNTIPATYNNALSYLEMLGKCITMIQQNTDAIENMHIDEEQIEQNKLDIEQLNADIETLQGEIDSVSAQIEQALTPMQEEISGIQGDISSIQGDITSIQGDITRIDGLLTIVGNDLINLRTHLTNDYYLKDEIDGALLPIQQDIEGIKADAKVKTVKLEPPADYYIGQKSFDEVSNLRVSNVNISFGGKLKYADSISFTFPINFTFQYVKAIDPNTSALSYDYVYVYTPINIMVSNNDRQNAAQLEDISYCTPVYICKNNDVVKPLIARFVIRPTRVRDTNNSKYYINSINIISIYFYNIDGSYCLYGNNLNDIVWSGTKITIYTQNNNDKGSQIYVSGYYSNKPDSTTLHTYYTMADADQDGEITLEDAELINGFYSSAVLAQTYTNDLAGWTQYLSDNDIDTTQITPVYPDANRNGTLEIGDALLVNRYYAKTHIAQEFADTEENWYKFSIGEL